MENLGAIGLQAFTEAIVEEIDSRGKTSALKSCFPEVDFVKDA